MAEREKAQQDIWLERFSDNLDRIIGADGRREIMKGSDILLPISRCPFFASFPIDYENRIQTIDWTKNAMKKLDETVVEDEKIEILTSCACHFPKSLLKEIRKTYEETKDVDKAHAMLQNQFIEGLKRSIKDEALIKKIQDRGWGVAGVKKGNTIVATKMPFEREKYFSSFDPVKKRYHYCHCARIREIYKMQKENISFTYCYCGAGFYKGIWEEILQKPVKVKIIESLLKGDDVCKIAINLF